MIRAYLIGAAVSVGGGLVATLVANVTPIDLDPKTSGAMAFVCWHTWYQARQMPRLIKTFRTECRRRAHNEQANRDAFMAAIDRLTGGAPKPPTDSK